MAQLAYAIFYLGSRLAVTALSVATVLVLLQDVLVFPSAELYLFTNRPVRSHQSLPQGIESFMMPNEAGRFEIWRMRAPIQDIRSKRIAIVAKGNGGTVDSMQTFQRWFATQGITSYALEYRGYGLSSGWPSQGGIFEDMKRLWSFALKEEGVEPGQVIVLGQSLGTGPATYLASIERPAALILISPYTSIDDVVRDRPRLNVLAPFVWNRFPSKEFIQLLDRTCVISVHGGRDTEILVHHTSDLQKLYKGSSFFSAFIDPQGDHNDIFDRTRPQIEGALQRCLTLQGAKSLPDAQ